MHFHEWNIWISLKLSLKFVPKGRINNIPALVQIMAWRRPGDKPLSEAMMVSLPTHICVTWSQWVNRYNKPILPPWQCCFIIFIALSDEGWQVYIAFQTHLLCPVYKFCQLCFLLIFSSLISYISIYICWQLSNLNWVLDRAEPPACKLAGLETVLSLSRNTSFQWSVTPSAESWNIYIL